MDRYGHLFPSAEQRLYDKLDAVYTAALAGAADTGHVIDLGRQVGAEALTSGLGWGVALVAFMALSRSSNARRSDGNIPLSKPACSSAARPSLRQRQGVGA